MAALILTHALLLSAAAQQGSPPKGRISTAEILSKYTSAIGGADALQQMQTLEVHGEINFFPSTRRYDEFEFYYKAPSSDLFEFESIGHGSVTLCHDHGKLWTRNVGIPIGILNGIPTSVMSSDWIALAEPENEQLYKRVELIGISKLNGRWAYAVRFSFKSGEVQVRYYDCESFFLVGLDQVVLYRDEVNGPDRPYKVETDFLKYKPLGGLSFPTLLTFHTSAQNLDLEVVTIKANANISDSKFEKR